ncbi:hypothetical protein SAT01_36830 [Sinomonas atrocyanea]|nr:hypothetical protein SAT01_36830 [Sinomonas atrocyanea]
MLELTADLLGHGLDAQERADGLVGVGRCMVHGVFLPLGMAVLPAAAAAVGGGLPDGAALPLSGQTR